MIDGRWLAYLAIPAAWTIFFSTFNTPGIRGWRYLGWLACYLVGIAMFASIGWRHAGMTWVAVGLATGALYYTYDRWTTRGHEDPQAHARLSTIIHGVVAWPIMLPEVIEYTLAEAGVLKAGRAETPAVAVSQSGVEQGAEADEHHVG